jgi:hypothetical protein
LYLSYFSSKRKTLPGYQYSASLENKNRGMIYHTKYQGLCAGYSKNMLIPSNPIAFKNIFQFMHNFGKDIQTNSTRR